MKRIFTTMVVLILLVNMLSSITVASDIFPDLKVQQYDKKGNPLVDSKTKEYVYLVTSLYREAIDSYLKTGKVYINQEKLHDLKIVFARDYTKGFLFNEDNNNVASLNHSKFVLKIYYNQYLLHHILH